jgi:hypothetical protein
VEIVCRKAGKLSEVAPELRHRGSRSLDDLIGALTEPTSRRRKPSDFLILASSATWRFAFRFDLAAVELRARAAADHVQRRPERA